MESERIPLYGVFFGSREMTPSRQLVFWVAKVGKKILYRLPQSEVSWEIDCPPQKDNHRTQEDYMAKKSVKAAKKAPAKKAAAKKAAPKKAAPKKATTKAASAAPKAVKVTAPAGKAITASALLNVIAEHMAVSRAEAKRIVESYTDIVKAHVMKGVKVKIGDIGMLLVRARKARMGRNPQTGEPVKIKASKKLAFRQSATMRDMMKK
jgi:nucleoid DNA-binding protein